MSRQNSNKITRSYFGLYKKRLHFHKLFPGMRLMKGSPEGRKASAKLYGSKVNIKSDKSSGVLQGRYSWKNHGDYYQTNSSHVADIKGLKWMGRKGNPGIIWLDVNGKCQRWTALAAKVLSVLTWIVAMTQPTRGRQRCKPCPTPQPSAPNGRPDC